MIIPVTFIKCTTKSERETKILMTLINFEIQFLLAAFKI